MPLIVTVTCMKDLHVFDKKGPVVGVTLASLMQKLKHGFKLFSSAEFAQSAEVFKTILLNIPLLSLSKESEQH